MRCNRTLVLSLATALATVQNTRAGIFETINGLVPWAISADGSTLVGFGPPQAYVNASIQAAIWTQANGVSYLNTGAGEYNVATGVSGDGSVVVGYNSSGTGTSVVDSPWVWTATGGYEPINVPGFASAEATSITADGRTIGIAAGFPTPYNGTPEMYMYDASSGLTQVPKTLSGQSPNYVNLSANGKIAFGSAGQDNGYIWTGTGNAQDIPTVPGTSSGNDPETCTSDGSSIFGQITESSSYTLFRYSNGVTTSLGTPHPGAMPYSYTYMPQPVISVDGDGSLLVGTEEIQNPADPSTPELYSWIWTPMGGFESLQSFLLQENINIGEYQINYITGISLDGTSLCGVGYSSSTDEANAETAWIIHLPEPGGSMVLATLVLAGLRRRHHSPPKKRFT